MSKQEDDKEKPVEQSSAVATEPAKRAPEHSQDFSAKPAKPVKRRGFFATVFSHLAVATIAVIGVGAYMHWDDILTYTGSRVCAYDVLGKYAKAPVKAPSIDTQKTKSKTEPKIAAKAKEKPSDSSTKNSNQPAAVEPKTTTKVENPKPPSFESALQAARKQFWENDKAAVSAYEALVVSKPNDAALQAELANVYLKNQDKPKAVKAFLNAGKMHIEQKQTKKATSILDVLKKISPEKSAELSKLIDAASN